MSAPHPLPQLVLRPQQREAVRSVARHFGNGVFEQLVVLPTGYGKTKCGLFLASCFQRALFICPSIELEEQTLRAWHEMMPEQRPGIVKGRTHQLEQRLTVSTPQTLHRRLSSIPRDAFDLIIVDEAHHAGSKQQAQVLGHFQHKLRLGLTATPERYDGIPLDALFRAITFSRTLKEAVEDGVLARPVGYKVCTRVSLALALKDGDYDPAQLERIVNIPARNALVVRTWHQSARERLTVAFCASVEHARDLAATFVAAGVVAEAVWGSDPDRKNKVERLRQGVTRVLCNCNVLSEGFDCPPVSCVLLTRPTRSRTRFTQQAGRGLRTHPGKRDGLIVLFQDETVNTLGVDLWDFVGTPQMVQGAVDLENGPRDLLLEAQWAEEREGRREGRDALEERLRKITSLSGETRAIDLLKPPPVEARVRTWNSGARNLEPTTPAQEKRIARLGYDVGKGSYTRQDAHAIIARAHAERPAESGILKRLSQFGYDTQGHPWSHGQAEAALMSELKPGVGRRDRAM